jgi:hypothetical protein
MPRTKINKSQKIRDMFNELGLDTSPKEIVTRLAQRGIKVTGQNVSMIKMRMRKKAATNRHPEAAKVATGATEHPAARAAQRSFGMVHPESVTTWLQAAKAAKHELGDDVARELYELS